MKILIVGMAGSGNFGDDLIAYYLIEKILLRYPKSQVYILIGQEEIKFVKIPDSVIKLVKPKSSSAKERWLFNQTLKDLFKDLDLLFIGGGGLFQDSHSIFTIHKYLKYFKFLNSTTRVIGVGLGVGPINSRFAKRYLKTYLKYFNHLQVRDNYSKNMLNKWHNSVSISPDIVLGSDVSNFLKNNSGHYLGASIRPTPTLNILDVLDSLEKLYNQFKLKLVLFIFEDKRDSHIELDFNLKVLQALMERGVDCEISSYRDDTEFVEKFSNVKCAMASRYHANILWQKNGTYVKSIVYAPKVQSLYEEFQIADHMEGYLKLEICASYELPELENYIGSNITFRDKLKLYIFSLYEVMTLLRQKVFVKNKKYGFNIQKK